MKTLSSSPAPGHLSRLAPSAFKGSIIGMLCSATALLAGASVASAQALFQSPPNPGGPALADEVRQFVSFDASHAELKLIHIRVIDGTGAAPLEDRTVIIRNGRIAAIAPSGASEQADGKQALDMAGRTLLPGLVGMHDHLFYVARPGADFEHAQRVPLLLPQMTYTAPRLYLAGGVTTIRTAGSMEPYADLNLKQAIENNQLPGPHMDVTGPATTTRAATDKAVAGIEANPLAVLGGGIAIGLLVGAFVPRTDAERKILRPVGKRLNETARGAVDAARDTAKAELDVLGLSRDAARDQVSKLLGGVIKALTTAGTAALAAKAVVEQPQPVEGQPAAQPADTPKNATSAE